MSSKRSFLLGAGALALGLGAYAAAQAAADAAPTLEDEVIVVSAQGEAEVVEGTGLLDPHVLPGPHQRWAMGAMLGGLIAGLAGLVGFNRLLNWTARAGRTVARASVAAAKAPVKAAKIAGAAAMRTLKTPGQWALGIGAVGLFLIAGIALLDVQWKAGLAIGAGTAIAGTMVYARAKGSVQSMVKGAKESVVSPFRTAETA